MTTLKATRKTYLNGEDSVIVKKGNKQHFIAIHRIVSALSQKGKQVVIESAELRFGIMRADIELFLNSHSEKGCSLVRFNSTCESLRG